MQWEKMAENPVVAYATMLTVSVLPAWSSQAEGLEDYGELLATLTLHGLLKNLVLYCQRNATAVG